MSLSVSNRMSAEEIARPGNMVGENVLRDFKPIAVPSRTVAESHRAGTTLVSLLRAIIDGYW